MSVRHLCFLLLQGDRESELGLPISPLCDRHNTLVAESQIGAYALRVAYIGISGRQHCISL